MRIQQGSRARAANAVRDHDGTKAAILLLIAGDHAAHQGLTRVFSLHDAPMADLERRLPGLTGTSGDCVIRDDGILMTLEGIGRYLMGVRLNASWGFVNREWRDVAMEQGCVWAGLLPEAAYPEGTLFGSGGEGCTEIPELPVLKLEALPAK